MRALDFAATLATAADALTAVAGACNAVLLFARQRGTPSPSRRNATLVLAAVNAGIAVQAAFALALYSSRRFDVDIAPFFDAAPWVASRALLLAATLAMSFLIFRRPR